MSADRLREAARVLRERAEDVRPAGSWRAATTGDGLARVFLADGDNLALHGYPYHAAYIATMHPGVGLALADWLLRASGDVECRPEDIAECDCPESYAFRLANLILGGES